MSCCHKPLAIYRSCGNDLYERATAMKKRSVSALIDDEPIDPEEAPMSEAAFAVIQRAHQLCGHPAAVDLTVDLGNSELLPPQRAEQALTEGELIVHARKILSAHLRARELVHQMQQRGDFDLNVSDLVETDSEGSHQCESSLGDDEPDEVVTDDWTRIARDAWDGESWKDAAMDYHTKRRKQGMRQ
jgi:hypothetical protein